LSQSALASPGDAPSGRGESGELRGQTEILFGLIQEDPRPRLKDKLGEGTSYVGGAKVAMSDFTFTVEVRPITVSVTATIDFYTDADGNTHIVFGGIQRDGTWEIASDITL
jgi:hypothetical protein